MGVLVNFFVFIAVSILLFFPIVSMGSDYILKKDTIVFSTPFQIAHLENLNGDAFSGYVNDQIQAGTIAIAKADVNVIVVDECTFCRYLKSYKVKAINGKGVGWVLRDQLVVINKKKIVDKKTTKAKKKKIQAPDGKTLDDLLMNQ